MKIEFLYIFLDFILFAFLSYYFILSLQWYSYKLKRAIFNHTKPMWHIWFFILPLVLYYIFDIQIWLIFYALLFYLWHKKLDKKLVFTARVRRFFYISVLVFLFTEILCIKFQCFRVSLILPIFIGYFISNFYELILAKSYEKQALEKLKNMPNLKIITITASFGKTSIKNFLYELTKDDFKTYKSPKSVNTKIGLIQDINTNLDPDTELYIAEAGARASGDIKEIADLLSPQIAIIGEIGKAHIEYFKSINNIRDTKMELTLSKRLEKAFIHASALVESSDKFVIYNQPENIISTLDGLLFDYNYNGEIKKITSKLLGSFNASNLQVCIDVALFLGLDISKIIHKISQIKSVEHRLQKIEANGKLIIDDSFNGNLKGMLSSYELVKSYPSRKVLITPGIVESTKEDNETLAKTIDEVFDLVILTSSLNYEAILPNLTKAEVFKLSDKTKMQEILTNLTQKGDLILFSNDAPSFV